MLQERPLTSGEIATAFEEAWPTITGHLAVLREAGLVESEKHGTSVRYRLSISALEEALAFLLDLQQGGARRVAAPKRKVVP